MAADNKDGEQLGHKTILIRQCSRPATSAGLWHKVHSVYTRRRRRRRPQRPESESLVLVTAPCHIYYVHRTVGRTPSGLAVSILVLQ